MRLFLRLCSFPPLRTSSLPGSVGGGIWHFIKGYRNAPKHARVAGALTAARMRAPVRVRRA